MVLALMLGWAAAMPAWGQSPASPRAAVEAWTMAALQGDVEAQHSLGQAYAEGRGIARDYERAQFWLERAARQGHVPSMVLLGGMFLGMDNLPPDYAKACWWLRQGAERGSGPAEHDLSLMTAQGLGTPVDLVKAWVLANAAEHNGVEQAVSLRHDIEGVLTTDQLARARAMALAEAMPAAASPADMPILPAPQPAPVADAAPTPAPGPAVADAAPTPAPVSVPLVEAPPPPPPAPVVAEAPPTPPPAPVAVVEAPPTPPPAPAPVVEAPPAPSPAPVRTGPPSTAIGWRTHLVSVRVTDDAAKEWQRLQHQLGTVLAGREPVYEQVDLPAKGRFTRIYVAGFDGRAEADGFCRQVSARKVPCAVERQ